MWCLRRPSPVEWGEDVWSSFSCVMSASRVTSLGPCFSSIVIAMTPASLGCARLIRENRAPGWLNEGITPAAECGLMTIVPTS